MLKAEALPTQESAIGAITALVQKVQILLCFVPSCAVAVDALLRCGHFYVTMLQLLPNGCTAHSDVVV
jgi:hypothetical protein